MMIHGVRNLFYEKKLKRIYTLKRRRGSMTEVNSINSLKGSTGVKYSWISSDLEKI